MDTSLVHITSPPSPTLRHWQRRGIALTCASLVLSSGLMCATDLTAAAAPIALSSAPSTSTVSHAVHVPVPSAVRAAPQHRGSITTLAAGHNAVPAADATPLRKIGTHASSSTEWDTPACAALSVLTFFALTTPFIKASGQSASDPYIMLGTSSESQLPEAETPDGAPSEPPKNKRSFAAFLHPLAFTLFLAQAAHAPSPLTPLLPQIVWRWLHLSTGMLFGGLICSSTLYEALVIKEGTPELRKWWFDRVGLVDRKALFPVLGMSVVSGVCLAQYLYGPLKSAPPYIPLSLEALLLFGAYWAFLDRRTQGPAQEQCQRDFEAFQRGDLQSTEGPPEVLQQRLRINLISCAAVGGIYLIMVTKPAFHFLGFF